MSPSKMCRTQWYREGELAFHMDEGANPYVNDPLYYDRRKAWDMGWDEAKQAAEETERWNAELNPAIIIENLLTEFVGPYEEGYECVQAARAFLVS